MASDLSPPGTATVAAPEAGEPPATASFTFCDDFRQELNGKHSLMGIYGAMLLLPVPVQVLPKLVAVLHLNAPTALVDQVLTIALHDQGNLVAEVQMALQAPPPGSQTDRVAALPGFRMNVTAPMEMVGFEAKAGMRLVMSARLGGLVFTSTALTVAHLAPATAQPT